MSRQPVTTLDSMSAATAVVVMTLFVLSGSALAEPSDPQNIVVIMADDLDWTDLPFFNHPVRWETVNGVPKTDGNPGVKELRYRLPTLNRIAARLYAEPEGETSPGVPSGRRGLGTFNLHKSDDPYTVKPLDFAGDEPDFYALANDDCKSPNNDPVDKCNPSTDIYENSGGLKAIASGGGNSSIVFGRFYSTSAVCSPARASFFTGRHAERIGVPKQDEPMDSKEVTIAEFLKQGCVDSDQALCVKDPTDDVGKPIVEKCECYMEPLTSGGCAGPGTPCECKDAACYATGLVGKWHIGMKPGDGSTPWQQGFDEFIGIGGGDRKQFSRRDLDCSPGTRKETWYCFNETTGAFASTPIACPDTSCPLGSRCGADVDKYGLYLGELASPGVVCDNSGQEESDVECCKSKGWSGGRFKFKEKTANFVVDGGLVKGRDVRRQIGSKFPCNDPGEIKTTQCIYATRWMRDHAVKFIKRHKAAAQPGGSTPFFLFVGFTATHSPHQAPYRTREHYLTETIKDARIKAPTGKTNYWAMLEDLDEAVGAIIAALEESPSIMGNTVVLFTSDHGRAGSLYGNPQLRGGKSNLLEGGMRVGLLIRGDGLFSGRSSRLVTDDTMVGSFTDVFQTIAAAAGYDDLAGNGGSSADADSAFTDGGKRIPYVSTCDASNQNRGCGNGYNDCPGAAPEDCLKYYLDGTNLVPFLKGGSAPRDLAYARYKSDTHTVSSVKGYFDDPAFEDNMGSNRFATHVCGYNKTVGACSEDSDTSCITNADCSGTCDSIVRQVRAASCTACDFASNPGCSDNLVFCDILGGVCVTQDEKDDCEKSTLEDPCLAKELPRCRKSNECTDKDTGEGPEKRTCIKNARVACDECMPTSWKFRGPGKKKDKDGALYDLTTNPEEAPKFSKKDPFFEDDDPTKPNGRLNCRFPSAAPTDAGKLKVYASQQCLVAIADEWKECVIDNEDPHCELGAPGVTLISTACEAVLPP